MLFREPGGQGGSPGSLEGLLQSWGPCWGGILTHRAGLWRSSFTVIADAPISYGRSHVRVLDLLPIRLPADVHPGRPPEDGSRTEFLPPHGSHALACLTPRCCGRWATRQQLENLFVSLSSCLYLIFVPQVK